MNFAAIFAVAVATLATVASAAPAPPKPYGEEGTKPPLWGSGWGPRRSRSETVGGCSRSEGWVARRPLAGCAFFPSFGFLRGSACLCIKVIQREPSRCASFPYSHSNAFVSGAQRVFKNVLWRFSVAPREIAPDEHMGPGLGNNGLRDIG
ncbi:hypothetical protein BDK51DRAFT_34852 [Blyttiomyces helicus]|uniref:Uncharacterized protein n=1 Tax=Blyttiomyces helicus TaxID=388810 RepID=A0A4P9WQ48_9FUNG|nr:hypothetical protein BDK51DRAFT_34852 [Blyttiomyces helicus]|eukprot:RKO94495.1 hypothetical protein BDK51DRAFT_34852 [Blyttiomyces helicus]